MKPLQHTSPGDSPESSAGDEPVVAADGQGQDLDLLVPPIRPWWVRGLFAVAALGLAGALGWSASFGYLYPNPGAWGSGSGSHTSFDPATGKYVVGEAFYNFSGRSLEIVDVAVDVSGVEIEDIHLGLEKELERDAGGPVAARTGQIPGVVGPKSIQWIIFELEPTDCDEVDGSALPSVEVTVRLAEPAFPPFSRTVAIEPSDWVDHACSAEVDDR